MRPNLWTSQHGYPAVRAHMAQHKVRPQGRQTVYVATPDRLHGYRDMALHVVDGYPLEHVQRFILEVTLGRFAVVEHEDGETCRACRELREAAPT